MKKLLLLAVLVSMSASASAPALIESQYTPWLKKKLNSWPKDGMTYPALSLTDMKIEALETQDERYYIGIHQWMKVKAPLERLTEVIENFAEYQKYFPGTQEISVVEKSPTRILTAWEQPIPVFFIPNVKFQLQYDIDRKPQRTVFQYQLKESRSLDACDGLVVLDGKGGDTYYTEYGFSLTKGGMLHAVGPSPIWKDSIKSAFLSKFALKLRAENPDWDFDKVKKEAEAQWDKFPVEEVLKSKTIVD